MTGADENYDPRAVQDKWLARWDELNPFAASEDPAEWRART
jgi:leucyl-tRNA synthetase